MSVIIGNNIGDKLIKYRFITYIFLFLERKIKMATIKINNSIEVKGKVSFTHSAYLNKEKQQWEDNGVEGTLVTHQYLDDIHTIETDRFLLSDCTVYVEAFGSDDFDITYKFIADSCIVKDDPLSKEEIQKIEDKKYAYEKINKFLYGIAEDEFE